MIDVTIRPLYSEDLQEALTIAWEVFSQTQAKTCTAEGIEEFWTSIDFEFMLFKLGEGELRFWGAFAGDSMVGMICFAGLTHVRLLYVLKPAWGKGIAARLLKRAVFDSKLNEDSLGEITADVPPCAYTYFEEQGFEPVSPQIFEFGQSYTRYVLRGGQND